MKRRMLVQLVVPLLVLCVLFSLLAYPAGRDRRQPDLLEVSVIFREADDDVWSTARQGMEQAASDLNVELRFLTPTEEDTAAEQAQLLAREVEGGAGAVVLLPADRAALNAAAAAASEQAALVTMETELAAAAACVGPDNAALGQALAQTALNGVAEGGTVVLLDSARGDNGIRERLEAAGDVLAQAGRRTVVCRPEQGEPFVQALEETLRAVRADAVVAFEASALEQAGELAQAAESFPLLYGMGSTAAIAAGLERSRITAIAAQNEFSAGYLAVEAAAKLARRQTVHPAEPLAFTIVRRENMYEPDNQKLLFPVTR